MQRLIQNTIILWNYLYLTELLLICKNIEQRNNLLDTIKNGSIIIWKHINLYGTYDFTTILDQTTNRFDLETIRF